MSPDCANYPGVDWVEVDLRCEVGRPKDGGIGGNGGIGSGGTGSGGTGSSGEAEGSGDWILQ